MVRAPKIWWKFAFIVEWRQEDIMKKDELTSLQIYRKSLDHYPPLSEEEERKLIEAMTNGDEKAREKLINHNLRFAYKIAYEFTNKGVAVEDLISEANAGLCAAANKYNAKDHSVRFQTYAGYWIRQSIYKSISHSIQFYMPEKSFTAYRELKANEYLQDKTDDELSEIFGISASTISSIRIMTNLSTISLDAPPKDDETQLDLPDFLEDSEARAIENCIVTDVREATEDLPERECDILKRMNGIGVKQEDIRDIAKSYDLSVERIRQLNKTARNKLEIRLRKKYGTIEE